MRSNVDALHDIFEAIVLAQQFTWGMTKEQFKKDRKSFFATTRALEIASEASRYISDEVRKRNPDLPWANIRDAGNAYRHNYDNITESVVWNTVIDDLPPLLEVILAEIERLKAPS